MLQQRRAYIEIINQISDILNDKEKDSDGEKFLSCVQELNYNFKIQISTKFLKGLSDIKGNTNKRRRRINYCLNRSGLTTIKISHFWRELVLKKFEYDIIEYTNELKKMTQRTTRDLNQPTTYIKSISHQTIGREYNEHQRETLNFLVA